MSDNDLSDVLDGIDIENTTVEERSFDPLPPGDYLAQAVEGSVVRKDNGNAMIKLTFEVMEGDFERRRIWLNLNIRNANPTAQRIATEQLTELWRDALGGKGNPPAADDLCYRPVLLRIEQKKRKDTGTTENVIKKFMPANGSAPPASKAPASQAAPAANGSRPSWLKKSA